MFSSAALCEMSSRVQLQATRRALPKLQLKPEIERIGPRPIRVGFVVHLMQVAGAEVLTREIIQKLRDHLEPTIICLDSLGQIGEEMRAQGVDVRVLGRRPGRDWRVPLRMARVIRERGIDVVHAHQYTPFFYAALAKFRHPRFKLMITEHGRHFPDRVHSTRRALNRLVLDRLADAVTACSKFSADGLCKSDGFAGARIRVIDNGVEVGDYGPAWNRAAAKRKVGLDAGRKHLIHAARHHPVKDQATLLNGFALAAPMLPDFDLVMVGDGILRKELEAQSVRLGIADRVKFLGVRNDVPDLLRASEVFVLSSLSEAASLTLMEAMATGLPSVITDVGGNHEIARDEVEALMFERRDAEGLAACLLRLQSEPDLARSLGSAARRRAEERFHLDRTVEEYYRTYCSLIGWTSKSV
jgi:glycosyltransferase involved in cell wall biosynthesis